MHQPAPVNTTTDAVFIKVKPVIEICLRVTSEVFLKKTTVNEWKTREFAFYPASHPPTEQKEQF